MIKGSMAINNQVDWDKLKVGTYLEYTAVPAEGTNGQYVISSQYSGTDSDQTVTAETINRWRILSVDRENGTVELLANTSTSQKVTLAGAQGYNNGVYLLNDLCNKLYGNSTFGATARNINEYDLVSKLASESTYKNYINTRADNSTYTFGEVISYTEHGAYPSQFTNDNSDTDNYIKALSKSRELIESGNATGGGYSSPISAKTADYTIEEWNPYFYDYADGNSITRDIIFYDDESHTLDFWLASRYVSTTESDQVLFGISRVSGIIIRFFFGGSSNWWSNSNSQSVRPVVTLPANYINTSVGNGTKVSPYLVSEVTNSEKTIVSFADTTLYNLMKTKLNGVARYTANDTNLRMELEASELAKVKSLNLSDTDFADISGLEKFTSLTELYLNNNSVSNLTPLSSLTNLKKLSVYGTDVYDISPVSNLTNLEELNLSRNDLWDGSFSKLSNLTKLKKLDISHNYITGISGISNLTNLEELNLFDNAITDFSQLSGLIKLEILNIAENNEASNSISGVNAIGNLTNLKELNFSYNNHANITQYLTNLTKLEVLDLTQNRLTNSNLSDLSGLTNLKELNLNDNDLSDISPLLGLSRLEYLNINNNDYSSLDGVWNNGLVWPNMTKLSIAYNNISSSSSGISNLIGLSNNKSLELNYEYITNTSSLPHVDGSGIRYVTYDDFGARCDGVYDDYIAIRNAHLFANEHGYEVRGTSGKTYHIFKYDEEPVTIKTNVDWKNANFIIHDEIIDSKKTRHQSIFKFTNSKTDEIIERWNVGWTINKNTKKISQLASLISELNNKGYKKYFVTVKNSNKRQFIRYGGDANSGYIQTDNFVMDSNCNLLNDVMWDFDTITYVRIIPIADQKSYIKNGSFTTNYISSKSEANYVRGNDYKQIYFLRNIYVYDTTNLEIRNITHNLSQDVVSGSYNGFIRIREGANVKLENIDLIERKTLGVGRSTYDLEINNVVNVLMRNINTTTYTERNRWGVTGTSYCKDFVVDNCTLNRVDAHEGVYNLTVKDSTVGYFGVEVVGAGKLLIDNSTLIAQSMLQFRSDYGSFWDGDVYIKDTTYKYDSKWSWYLLKIDISPIAANHNFGYPVKLPNIYMENITFDNANKPNENEMRIFALWDRSVAESTPASYWNDVIYLNGFKFSNSNVGDAKLTFSTLNLSGQSGNYLFTNMKFVHSNGVDLTHRLNLDNDVVVKKNVILSATKNTTAENEITIYKNNQVLVEKFKLTGAYNYSFTEDGRYKVVVDSTETTFNAKTGHKEFVFEIDSNAAEPDPDPEIVVVDPTSGESTPDDPIPTVTLVVEPTCNNQVYDATEKTIVNGSGTEYEFLDSITYTAIGDYTIRVRLKDKNNYKWKNSGSTDDLTLSCKITAPPTTPVTLVQEPSCKNQQYDGSEKYLLDSSGTEYTVSSNAHQIQPGTYVITVSLKDKDNYKWKNSNSTEDLKLSCKITEAQTPTVTKVTEPTCNNQEYDGTEKYLITGYGTEYTISNNARQTEIGTYIITISLKDKTLYKWKNSNSSDDLKLSCKITAPAEPTIVNVKEPTCNDQVYDGTEKLLVNGNGNEYSYSSNIIQKEVGIYTIIVTLKDKQRYRWEASNSASDLRLKCEIKAPNTEPGTPGGNTPSNPTPSNPTPSNPTPSNPTPSNPTPSNPTPSNPTPSGEKKKYTITEGGNQLYSLGNNITIKTDGELENFVEVKIDGVPLDKEYYEMGTDGVVIILKDSYLRGLQPSIYKVTIVFKDGEAETEFTVDNGITTVDPSTTDKPTKTEDEKKSNVLPIILVLIVAAGLIFVLFKFVFKRNNNNNGETQ